MEDSVQIQKLVARGAAEVRAEQSNAAEVARGLVDEFWSKLSVPDKRSLAQTGLAKKIADYMHSERNGSRRRGEEKRRLAKERKDRREKKKQVLDKGKANRDKKISEIVYGALHDITLDCEGRSKALLNFTSDDVTAWRALAEHQTGAWRARTEWFAKTQIEMGRIDARRVGDLPAPVLVVLNSMAEKAWGNGNADAA